MATRQIEESDDDGGGDEELIAPDVVEAQQNLLEQIGAAFGIDDEYLAAMLANQVQMGRIEQAQLKALEEMRGSGAEVVGEFPVEMSHYVPADTPTTDPVETVRVPDQQNPSRITAISLGWQDGASNVVGVKIRTGDGLTLLPRNPQDDFIAFNDFSDTWDLRYELDAGEKLVAETVNLDAQNQHFVNIVPHIEELDTGDENGGGD